MTHPPEELLMQHAFGLTDLADHLDDCSPCRSEVEAILAESDDASEAPVPEDLVLLESTIHREREAARALLEVTSDDDLPDAVEDDRLLTTGGIHVALERIRNMRRHDPLDALAVMTRIREHSHHLPRELEVEVLRETASTCRTAGAYASALEILDEAEGRAKELPVADFQLARIWYERARLAIDSQQPGGAEWAVRAAQTFRNFGDEGRYQRSLYLVAVAKYNDRDFTGTIDALRDLIPSLDRRGDRETLAFSWCMIGHASQKEDRLDDAEEGLRRALNLFQELEWPIESARANWGMSRVLLKRGKAEEAASMAEQVRNAFSEAGLVEESSLVALDLAEALIILGEERRAGELCRDTVETLSGLLSGPDAQRALAYLREVAPTAPRIHAVSSFLRDYRKNPEIAFEPPQPS